MEYVKMKGEFQRIRTYKTALNLKNNNLDDGCSLKFYFVDASILPDEYKDKLSNDVKDQKDILIGYAVGEYTLTQSNGKNNVQYAVVAKKLDDKKYFVIFTDGIFLQANIMQDGGNFINSTNLVLFTNENDNHLMTENLEIGNVERTIKDVDLCDEEALEIAESYILLKSEMKDMVDSAEYIVGENFSEFITQAYEYYEDILKNKKAKLYVPENENQYLFTIPFYDLLMRVQVEYLQEKERIIKKNGEQFFTKEKAYSIIETSIDNSFEEIDATLMEKYNQKMSDEQKELYRAYLKDMYEFIPEEYDFAQKNNFQTIFDDDRVSWGRSLYQFVARDMGLRDLICDDLADLFVYGLEEDYGVEQKEQILSSILSLECNLEDINTIVNPEDEKLQFINFVEDIKQIVGEEEFEQERDAMINVTAENVAIFRSLREYYNTSNEELFITLTNIAKEIDKQDMIYVDDEPMIN